MKNKKLSIIQEAVLAQIPKGLESPVRSQDIAESTGLSTREVMAVISALIIDHGIPIGGGRTESRKGYFIITNEDERQQATTPLKRTIVNMQQRIDHLEKIKL
ncbi:hypothetical protein ACEN32_06825 [Marinilactibacillus psychrotolerans]|uniref:hypothetical protein n=1 Tax=Marinilactibacillus psychrotolerans TaxID=191770 RepID=UPI003888FE2B